MKDDEYAALQKSVEDGTVEATADGEEENEPATEDGDEAEEGEETAAESTEGEETKTDEPPAEESKVEEPAPAQEPAKPAADDEKERMREALRLLGYEDGENSRGWEEAIAEMKGISVEEVRQMIGNPDPSPAPAAKPEAPAKADPATTGASIEDAELAALKEAFPQLADVKRLKDIPNFGKFALERYNKKGVVEAYATANGVMPKTSPESPVTKPAKTGKEHLHSSRTNGAAAPKGMSSAELRQARELFGNLPDKELYELYRRATR
jgi:hypothetical protein